MYLDVGADCVISTKEIVAIMDISQDEIQFLPKIKVPANQHYDWLIPWQVEAPQGEEYKSLIITTTKNYASSISAATLKKRMLTMMEDRK
jgi:Domain of unknown function (DUF370)